MQTVLDLIWLPAAKRGDDIAVPPQGVRKPERIRGSLGGAGGRVRPRNESRVADEGDTADSHLANGQVFDRLQKGFVSRGDEHAEGGRQVPDGGLTEIRFGSRRNEPGGTDDVRWRPSRSVSRSVRRASVALRYQTQL